MHVVLGSQNPVKQEAVRQAFELYFDEVSVISVGVNSGVQPFPMSESETLQGAINRAKSAHKEKPQANFAIGIEGGLTQFNNTYYIQAIAAVKKSEELSVARSVAIEVSQELVKKIDPTSDTSKHTVDKLLGRNDLFKNEGVMGVLTQKRLTRTQILRDAVICALPRLLLPEYYPKSA
ncbi:MAG: inosine/xanthosine triphosphatase [Promethearchaeota archaeon]